MWEEQGFYPTTVINIINMTFNKLMLNSDTNIKHHVRTDRTGAERRFTLDKVINT